MEKNIAWIGYVMQLNPLSTEIKLELGRKVDKLRNAETGLEAATTREYPIILVNDIVPAGDLELPNGVEVGDGHGIGAYVIRRIRETEINRNTPILVTHCGYFIGYSPEKAAKMYKEAGATELFNQCGKDALKVLEEFPETVRRLMKK
jgi:hypothetical protein